MKLEIPVLFHTDNTSVLKNVGIDYLLDSCEQRKVTFYNIDAISPYEGDNGEDYTTIHASNTEFVCPMAYEDVKSMIEA